MSIVLWTFMSIVVVNERNNLYLLHGVSRPSRSIVRENTQRKETRLWHIIREGRKEGLAQCQGTRSSTQGRRKNEKIEKCSKRRFVMVGNKKCAKGFG